MIAFWFILALLLVLLGWCGRGWLSAPARASHLEPKAVSRSRVTVRAADVEMTASVIILENHTVAEMAADVEKRGRRMPGLYRLLDMYQVERAFPDLSHFRLGPNMFEAVPLDWIILVDQGGGELIGHGVTTRIDWDQDLSHLPDGWQGAVRASYQCAQVERKKPNTLVGLFILIEDKFRKHGWARNVIEEMRRLGRARGLASLIIPLRPPLRYEREYAEMTIGEFAQLRRGDGEHPDHWIRLHTRLGAKVIGVSERSHQHALPLKDFYEQIPAPRIAQSGYVLVQQRDGGWYRVYADLERELVVIYQGCVWVQHPLRDSSLHA